MEYDEIVRRIFLLRAQAKEAKEEADALVASLGEQRLGKRVAGDLIVEVSLTKRFDPATAKKNLTPEQYAAILVPTPNASVAKAMLQEHFELTQKTYGTTMKVYRPTDEE